MADKREGLGKFFAARAAGALRRDREAGYHWGYLQGEGKIHCTCSFILDTGDNETLLAMGYPEVDLDVEPLVCIIGHHNLPSCKGIATALIVDHKLFNMAQDQEATAFCQKCRKVVQAVPLEEAKSFVETHNKDCGSAS
jgi:hypothetical protein